MMGDEKSIKSLGSTDRFQRDINSHTEHMSNFSDHFQNTRISPRRFPFKVTETTSPTPIKFNIRLIHYYISINQLPTLVFPSEDNIILGMASHNDNCTKMGQHSSPLNIEEKISHFPASLGAINLSVWVLYYI
jgi:hypothetical protein